MPGGQTSPFGDGGGSSQGGQFSANQAGPERGLQFAPETKGGNSVTPLSAQDSDAKGKKFAEEPWFAKLPPELRKAIRARGSRRPPRGYQERLRRYFENNDR
jgi:hypothetical protein